MTNHTQEPWVKWDKFPSLLLVAQNDEAESVCIPQGHDEASVNANADRILACINGCAGLNPAAYQECVEALKEAIDMITSEYCSHASSPESVHSATNDSCYAQNQLRALDHAEGRTP